MAKRKNSDELHPLSIEYLERTDLKHRKTHGQYFTPRKIREYLLSHIELKNSLRLLDPACGSGEFLSSAEKLCPGISLEGWDIDRKLISIAKKVAPTANISQKNALNSHFVPKYDVIIGNPPYFEFQPDENLKNKYQDVISGRPNIFALFIKLGLELLNEGGYLGFVVPPSMNNGAFFKNLRQYIVGKANIEHLKLLRSPALFHQAQQSVMVIILRKGKNRNSYIFKKNNLLIFTPNLTKLKQAFRNKTTFFQLGFKVKTGRIIWNEHKEKLTNSKSGATLLIKSENIKMNKIALLRNSSYPQYIKFNSFDIGPVIVVNRITGNRSQMQIKAALIEPGQKFLAENHVNVIFPPAGFSLKKLQNIALQIRSKETIEIMKLVTGNTQISKTELEKLLPLDPL